MQSTDARVRIQLKNILFCTDFSPLMDLSLAYAADLARHFGAKLYALHVRNPDDYVIVFPEGGSIPPGFTVEQATKKLNALLGPLSDIDGEVLVEEGKVWPTIGTVIEKNAIDLVVVGTRGRTGLTKLVLGSRAEEIFRRAQCPVLTVGPHSAHVQRDSIQQILYATDFTPESAAAAPYAISLAQEYQAGLTLLHVIVDPTKGDLVQPQELRASSERLLHELVPSGAEFWSDIHFEVKQGPVAETIMDVAEVRKVDLVVLGTRRPLGPPGATTHLPMSTAHKVVSGALCPVLTVRA
jgi:nucleotide-binding universal stress UspA family protein